MAGNISKSQKDLKEIQSDIKKKSENLKIIRENLGKSTRELEELRNRELEIKRDIDEEKRITQERKSLTTAVDNTADIDDFIKFNKEIEGKRKKLFKTEKIKSGKEAILAKETELDEQRKKFTEKVNEYDGAFKDLKEKEEKVSIEKKKIEDAYTELKELPSKLNVLRQQLHSIQRALQAAEKNNEKHAFFYYAYEMNNVIGKIEDLKKSKSELIKKTNKAKLEAAETEMNDAANKVRDLTRERDEISSGLRDMERSRDKDIIMAIKSAFQR